MHAWNVADDTNWPHGLVNWSLDHVNWPRGLLNWLHGLVNWPHMWPYFYFYKLAQRALRMGNCPHFINF